jgi:hypothetical protein
MISIEKEVTSLFCLTLGIRIYMYIYIYFNLEYN